MEDDAGEVLQVNLMDNTGSRGNDTKVLESLGAPLEESEALLVAVHLEFLVGAKGLLVSKRIYLDGVINNQVDGDTGIDQRGIAAQLLGGIAHGSQINDSGDSSEILKDNTSRLELNLSGGLRSDLCR